MSPEPWRASYWALCYLAVITTAAWHLRQTEELPGATVLNRLSWLLGSAFCVVLLAVIGDALLAETTSGFSVYGLINRVDAGSLPISRSSGLGRFAAIPGLAALVCIWTARGPWRFAALLVLLGSGGLIYLLQSRGAIFAFAGAAGFVLLFLGSRSRKAGILLLLLGAFLSLALPLIPGELGTQVWTQITRGEDFRQLLRLSGRVEDWRHGWEMAWRSPLWGWGFQADRYLMEGTHVHNTYLYAMLTAGLPGALLFAAGLAGAWGMLLRLMLSGRTDALGYRATLAQAGGMLVFFSLRSVPEVCGPLYNVDLMIMLPAMFFIDAMHRASADTPAPRNAPAPIAARA
jgi:O-antigen ligase